MIRLAMEISICFALSVSAIHTNAETYFVEYDPYAGVDWNTVRRCRAQHHDHARSASDILAYDDAGYDAVTFMTYGGYYRPSTPEELDGSESSRDSGKPVGWTGYRRWPPQDHGAPPPESLQNIKFYIPGAEEVGILIDGSYSQHFHSAFLERYIESFGCVSCGHGGIGVGWRDLVFPYGDRYASSQGIIDAIKRYGGHATLNHPSRPLHEYEDLEGFGSVEIYNNYMALLDEGDDGSRTEAMRRNWDTFLQTRSPRIWGISVNDWFGPYRLPGLVPKVPELTERNIDRGKIEVLVDAYDLPSYRSAFERGAFFAVIDDSEIKGAYPRVMVTAVTPLELEVSTDSDSDQVTWIANGEVVGTDRHLSLGDLPPGLGYARAEVTDSQGRTVYTQPVTLPEPRVELGLCAGAALLLGLARSSRPGRSR